MRLVTFSVDGHLRLGALQIRDGRETAVDLNRAAPRLPADMVSFLRSGAQARTLAAAALEDAPATAVHVLAYVSLKAVVPDPGKIICN